jgi:hypothetical protein
LQTSELGAIDAADDDGDRSFPLSGTGSFVELQVLRNLFTSQHEAMGAFGQAAQGLQVSRCGLQDDEHCACSGLPIAQLAKGIAQREKGLTLVARPGDRSLQLCFCILETAKGTIGPPQIERDGQ